MNYHLKNNRRNYSSWKPIAVLGFVIFFTGVFYLFFPKFASESIYMIAKPIWGMRDSLYQESSIILGTAFSDKEKIYRENLKLQIELQEAKTMLESLDTYKKENEDLRNILGRNSNEKKVLATVLSKPNVSLYDTLVVDVGSKDSIMKGDLVTSNNFIIGEVDEVYDSYSKVKLSSSYGEKKTVRVGSVSVDAIAQGRGGGNFIVKLPKDLTVTVGDLIKSIELGPRFYGKVLSIEKTETSAFQFILFKLPINIYTLDKVEIIQK